MHDNFGQELGKYAKLAILATLVEPKSLSKLGIFSYDENERFYKEKARQEIGIPIKEKHFVRDGPKIKANTKKLIDYVYAKVEDPEIKESSLIFWILSSWSVLLRANRAKGPNCIES